MFVAMRANKHSRSRRRRSKRRLLAPRIYIKKMLKGVIFEVEVEVELWLKM